MVASSLSEIVSAQLMRGGGVQKMVKSFFEHHPSRVAE